MSDKKTHIELVEVVRGLFVNPKAVVRVRAPCADTTIISFSDHQDPLPVKRQADCVLWLLTKDRRFLDESILHIVGQYELDGKRRRAGFVHEHNGWDSDGKKVERNVDVWEFGGQWYVQDDWETIVPFDDFVYGGVFDADGNEKPVEVVKPPVEPAPIDPFAACIEVMDKTARQDPRLDMKVLPGDFMLHERHPGRGFVSLSKPNGLIRLEYCNLTEPLNWLLEAELLPIVGDVKKVVGEPPSCGYYEQVAA